MYIVFKKGQIGGLIHSFVASKARIEEYKYFPSQGRNRIYLLEAFHDVYHLFADIFSINHTYTRYNDTVACFWNGAVNICSLSKIVELLRLRCSCEYIFRKH